MLCVCCITMPVVVFLYTFDVWLLLLIFGWNVVCLFMVYRMVRCVVHNNFCWVFPYILNVWLSLVDHGKECCVFMLCRMVRCVVHNNACCGFSVYIECVVVTC